MQNPECYCIQGKDGNLEIHAADELGFVYGIYEVSRRILGIREFWFWNDQKIIPQKGYKVEDDFFVQSQPAAIKFRGWFINDEVLIHTWSVNCRKDEPWEMVFETLLRCGGNLVIPGTDRNSEHYRPLAASMGLYITHHHAEPLGAEMFARAYPNLNPSYEEHAEKFHELWRQGIRSQKGMKVIWNIGFRGQGDCPFWVNDPRYQAPDARGELMSRLIQMQYDMVKEEHEDAICCTNLYGETMELYRDGYLKLPEDVIKIWADNGFGKMVTRRQENHNPRIYALPLEGDKGKHGIYYHVSFYDLQAANHITMLPNSPDFVKAELEAVLDHDVRDYWLVNCSNVKPHVYFLDFIAQIWRFGTVDVEAHRREYVSAYYGNENIESVSAGLADYPKFALQYGVHEDEHAGEQFANHVPRMLITQYLKDPAVRAGDLLWATDEKTLEQQIHWYFELCRTAKRNYEKYLLECESADAAIIGAEARELFRDSILLQARILYYCFTGAYKVCKSLLKAIHGKYKEAFYYAGCARQDYLSADLTMREREHGKWKAFYKNECLADVKQTAWVLKVLMGYVRNLGDGPHYYQWQREFLYSEEDRRVMLIMNMENHLEDEELFELMEARMGDLLQEEL
ncbi:MAG: glycosyl hydrolase 115 family protein [Oliverpabstia sp.]